MCYIMQSIRPPLDNMSYVDHTISGIRIRSALKYLDHEMGIDDLAEL